MKINFKQIIFNATPANRNIEYLVIHDTGNRRIGANAEAHFNYFNSGNRNASADFFVDDEEILQVNDYTKYYTWHCGDGKGQYGITNRNSIGIEMCVNSDGNFERVLANTIQLVKELKKKFPSAKVVRHYDASMKICPASLSHNNWQGWQEFLKRLEEPKTITIKVDGKIIETDVEPINVNGRVLVPVRAVAEALGCKVDWDGDTQTVKITR